MGKGRLIQRVEECCQHLLKIPIEKATESGGNYFKVSKSMIELIQSAVKRIPDEKLRKLKRRENM